LAVQAILIAGAVCGTMDITAALTVYGSFFGVKPLRLLQGVASGLIGTTSAYQGGIGTAALGLACHYVVAFGAATAYYLVSRKLRFLVDYAVPCGIAYAVIVYFAMQNVVLPLSRAAPRGFSLKGTVVGIAIHICCVGLPIALCIRRFGK
jgi:hypothetical protein